MAAPCAICGTEAGPISAAGSTPWRATGARFGVSGVLCSRCYARLWLRVRRGLPPMPDVRRLPTGPRPHPRGPCARCGTEGGLSRNARIGPARISGARFGLSGLLCHACYTRLADRLSWGAT